MTALILLALFQEEDPRAKAPYPRHPRPKSLRRTSRRARGLLGKEGRAVLRKAFDLFPSSGPEAGRGGHHARTLDLVLRALERCIRRFPAARNPATKGDVWERMCYLGQGGVNFP